MTWSITSAVLLNIKHVTIWDPVEGDGRMSMKGFGGGMSMMVERGGGVRGERVKI